MNNPKPKEWTSEQYSKGKIASYKPYNFVDGEGVRCSLYVSGCLFACEGCYLKDRSLIGDDYLHALLPSLYDYARSRNQYHAQGYTPRA